ncbi:FeoC-like transcriptional regulator [Azospirillum sp. ST 5-10]|uniref:FeoC-like transcriptional regulator n=1 Tax=unclassified Azospirillum TaxID=2630922 RepID=UPI003F49ED5B
MATLSDVRTFLSARHRASLAEIALGVDSSADATRALLDHWAAKARVRRVEEACGGRCGKSCCGDATAAEVYEWIGGPPPT